MISINDIDRAAKRISPHILRTPLLRSRWLSKVCAGEVYLKLENEQYTGSFKARGSLNKLSWLQEKDIAKLPVTASTGNHGLGFARALELLDMQGKIFLPHNAVQSKVEAIKAYNSEVVFHGDNPYETERFARQMARENGWMYVSPYNDAQVVAGQGTIGKEIIDQIDRADNILATVGGGGLIGGVARYIADSWPETRIVGCQPERSPEMAVSVHAGTYQEVESKPTLSDGSAGGFERDSITFGLCKKLVDTFILMPEPRIADAIRGMIKHHSKLVEGAAGVAVASLLQQPENFKNKTTIIIVCGANISMEKLRQIMC